MPDHAQALTAADEGSLMEAFDAVAAARERAHEDWKSRKEPSVPTPQQSTQQNRKKWAWHRRLAGLHALLPQVSFSSVRHLHIGFSALAEFLTSHAPTVHDALGLKITTYDRHLAMWRTFKVRVMLLWQNAVLRVCHFIFSSHDHRSPWSRRD